MENKTDESVSPDCLKKNKCSGRRNLGIDLLRMTAMFMVVILHVLSRAGVLDATAAGTLNYELLWLMRTFALCAVNCYAIISGYVGWQSQHKYYKLVSMWFWVEFYQFLAGAIIGISGAEDFSQEIILNTFLPVANNDYWYFTAYVGLFLFIPFLNKMIEKTDRKTFDKAFLCMFVFFCILSPVYTSAFFNTTFGFARGYSMIWLIVLYIVGGYLNKYGIALKLSKRALIFIYVGSCAAGYLSRHLLRAYTVFADAKIKYEYMYVVDYSSFFVVIAAVSLVLLFSKIEIKSAPAKWIIGTFSSVSFGVYLIHTQPLVWSLIENKLSFLGSYPPVLMILSILGIAAAVYIVCSIIDFGRLQLFKLLKIDRFSKSVVRSVSKIVYSLKILEK